MIRYLSIFSFLAFSFSLAAQTDSLKSKINFSGDFRFRVEQDWDSRKSSGEFRTDRSRLRYRIRAGVVYQHIHQTQVGVRLRTGNPRKQQDPQLTLGEGFNEFGTLPIALEKAYFQTELGSFRIWLGKNSFSFKKQNELFWSDNVFPEGIYLNKIVPLNAGWIDRLSFNAGHFIMNTRGGRFEDDSYMQGIQIVSQNFNDRVSFWPSLYLFKNIQNIPDGAETYRLNYSILSIGGYIKLSKSPLVKLEMDWYHNLEDYSENDSIPQNFAGQKEGITMAVSYGELSAKGNWHIKLTYANLQRYSALDFMAQNDWARWDYSAYDSPDGRLTNFQGIEFTVGRSMHDNITLKMKYYNVQQLVALGAFKENGQRIRFDIDVRF
ncbi:MAG: putative porin [Cytophagales bacterium]|nr:putative porin [Cytophagales bacterium]